MPRPGEATAWIMHQPFFSDLSREEANEAGSFCFIWGIFEYRVIRSLHKDESESLGRVVCREYSESALMPIADLGAEKRYFKRLFFSEDGEPTEVWKLACFRKNDRSDEIKAVLLGSNKAYAEDAEALIRIVVRLRNNFFHGFKWARDLKGQLDNFVHASSVLVKLMPPPVEAAFD